MGLTSMQLQCLKVLRQFLGHVAYFVFVIYVPRIDCTILGGLVMKHWRVRIYS